MGCCCWSELGRYLAWWDLAQILLDPKSKTHVRGMKSEDYEQERLERANQVSQCRARAQAKEII